MKKLFKIGKVILVFFLKKFYFDCLVFKPNHNNKTVNIIFNLGIGFSNKADSFYDYGFHFNIALLEKNIKDFDSFGFNKFFCLKKYSREDMMQLLKKRNGRKYEKR